MTKYYTIQEIADKKNYTRQGIWVIIRREKIPVEKYYGRFIVHWSYVRHINKK